MAKKNVNTNLVVILLVLAGLLGCALPAQAGNLEPPAAPAPTMKTLDEVEPRIPISSVPYTISVSGSYYLTGNLTYTGPQGAITVTVNNVTIDLMGYTLSGPGSGYNMGVYMVGRNNVEIRNGTVRAFGSHGIYEQDWNNGKGHRVINVRAVSNVGSSGIYLEGYDHQVKGCTAAANGEKGIYVGRGSIVTDSTAYSNQGHGISTVNSCMVTGNTVYSNQGNGINTGGSCSVIGNTANENQGIGINVLSACTVINNTAYGNLSDGIQIDSGGTVSGNTACSNHGHGIYADRHGIMVTGNTVELNDRCGIKADERSRVTGNITNSNGSSASDAGIWVGRWCVVKGNTVRAEQDGIYADGDKNSIEENQVLNSIINGINVAGSSNIIIKNQVSGFGTPNYTIAAGNAYGQIINVAGGGSFVNTDPTANFEF